MCDTGRHKVIDVECNSGNIKILANSSTQIPRGSTFITFNQKYTFDGSNFEDVFNYKTLGFSLDNLFDIFKLDHPKYIKIDVDGLESLILEGCSKVFNLADLSDNQILVYAATTGSFKNETAAASANANITGQGRNVGNSGVGIYKQNDSQYLEFYKLQSGPNATISIADNVLTIDALVGSGAISLGSANANTVVVADSNGNVFSGSDGITFDGTTFSFIGAGNNVTVANGLVTSNNLVTTNLTFAHISATRAPMQKRAKSASNGIHCILPSIIFF